MSDPVFAMTTLAAIATPTLIKVVHTLLESINLRREPTKERVKVLEADGGDVQQITELSQQILKEIERRYSANLTEMSDEQVQAIAGDLARSLEVRLRQDERFDDAASAELLKAFRARSA